jgi:hypothetical protein
MERVYAHLSKNGCRKSGLLADPELTVTLFLVVSTGLDPAGPLFDKYDPLARLDAEDAVFVDVVHTDTEGVFNLGTYEKERGFPPFYYFLAFCIMFIQSAFLLCGPGIDYRVRENSGLVRWKS